MRSLAAFLTGLIAVAAIIVALPTMWVTERVVDPDGFGSTATAMGQSAQVRTYMADTITNQVQRRAGATAGAVVAPFAQRYTQSPAFTEDFVDLAMQQHRWLFQPAPPGVDPGVMQLDLTNMVRRVAAQANPALAQRVPGPILVPVSDRDQALEAGRYQQSGVQVRRLAHGSVVVGVIAALLALLVARRRGTTLVWLGLGGVLSAAASFAGGYYFASRAKDEVAVTEAGVRQVAESAINGLVENLHQWCYVVGGVGVAVVVAGLVVRALTTD